MVFWTKVFLVTCIMLQDFVEGRGRSGGFSRGGYSGSRSYSRGSYGGSYTTRSYSRYSSNVGSYGHGYSWGSRGPSVIIFGGSYYYTVGGVRTEHHQSPFGGIFLFCCCCCIFVIVA